MSSFGQGYVPVRRGIMEHVFGGRLTPVEHHALMSMLLLADAATGTWRGSAPALTTILGYSSKNTMAEALDGLEAKGYILRDYAPGRRGNFPILIGKFLISRGGNAGKRIDIGSTKRRHGIPEGRLGKLIRKPLFHAIAAACSHPVLNSETDIGVDEGDDRGVRSSYVSRSESREERVSEGVTEGGSEAPAKTLTSSCGFAEEEEDRSKAYESEHSLPHDPKDVPLIHSVLPDAPSVFSATPTTQMSTPELLARQFFVYQGRPATLNTPDTLSLWLSTFTRLIQQYGPDDLQGAMHWSFEFDPFWPSHLVRPSDPLKYFEKKLSEQIMPRYLGWKTSEANQSKSQSNNKEGNHDKQQYRPSAPRTTGRQAVDNSSAAEEVKRRFAERLGCQE